MTQNAYHQATERAPRTGGSEPTAYNCALQQEIDRSRQAALAAGRLMVQDPVTGRTEVAISYFAPSEATPTRVTDKHGHSYTELVKKTVRLSVVESEPTQQDSEDKAAA